jgi:hypothetical protein
MRHTKVQPLIGNYILDSPIKNAQGEQMSVTDVAKPGEWVTPPADSTKPMPRLKTAGKVVAGVTGVILILLGVRAVKRGAEG